MDTPYIEDGWFQVDSIEELENLDIRQGCYFCDYKRILVPHHIIRKCDGGLDKDNNVIKICPNCHALIHSSKFFLGYARGKYYLINSLNHKDIIYNKESPNKDLPFSSLTLAIDKGKLIKTKKGFRIAKKQWKTKRRIDWK